MPHQTQRTDKGFSLIELLVVVLIIGLVASVAIPFTLSQRGEGVKAGQRADILTISSEVRNYLEENNYTPEDLSGPANLQLQNIGRTWTAFPLETPEAAAILTGSLTQDGQTIGGGVYLDGTYCISSLHAAGTSLVYQSTTNTVAEGSSSCPSTPADPTAGTPTTNSVPGPLVGFAAAGGTTAATVTWVSAAGATGYQVILDGIATSQPVSPPFTFTGVPAGTYNLTAWATNSAGAGPASRAVVTVRPLPDLTANRAVWLPLALAAGRTNTNATDRVDTYYDASYTKVAGIVKVQGMFNGTTNSGGDLIATLPEGYRPDYDMRFTSAAPTATTSSYSIIVEQDGEIRLGQATAPAPLSLDAIIFPAAGVAEWTPISTSGTVALANGWFPTAETRWGPPRYWTDPDGLVWFAGAIQGGTITAGTTIMSWGLTPLWANQAAPIAVTGTLGASVSTSSNGTALVAQQVIATSPGTHLDGLIIPLTTSTLDWRSSASLSSANWAVTASWTRPAWTRTTYGLVLVRGAYNAVSTAAALTTGVRLPADYCPRRDLVLVGARQASATTLTVTGTTGRTAYTLDGASFTPWPNNCGRMFTPNVTAGQRVLFYATYFGDL